MKITVMLRLVLASLFILCLFVFAGYQLLVMPMQANILALEKQIEYETKLYESIDVIEDNDEDPTQQKINDLQEQLPTQPFVDKLILDLEKAELGSNSLIMNMSFGVSALQEENSSDESEEQTTEETGFSPDGVEKVVVSMSVQSPTHKDLELFLKELEEMKRIIQIESLTFNGSGDQTGNTASSPVVFSIQISAFYYPNEDIMEDLNEVE